MIRVGPTGSKDSKLYVVGDAPQAKEVAAEKPLVGPAGNILWSALQTYGVLRSHCRVNNILHHKLPGDKWETSAEDQRKEGLENLTRDVLETKPNLVLLLGGRVLDQALGLKGIDNWRGSLLWSDRFNAKVLVLNHPRNIIYHYDTLPLFYFDCAKAAKQVGSKDLTQVKYELKLEPTLAEVMMWERILANSKEFAYDIETYPDPFKRQSVMRCIAFAPSRSEAICIPTVQSYWGDELPQIMAIIKRVLEDPGNEKIAQNGQFDKGVLKEAHGIDVANMTFDTMCAHHIAYPELPKSLATLISIYTDESYHKGMGHPKDPGWVPAREYYEYNALDAARTFHIKEPIIADLKDLGVYDYYQNMTHPLIDTMLELQHNGIKIDMEQFLKVRLGQEMRFVKTLKTIQAWLGYDLNPKSPKQMAALLYDGMGLPVQRNKGAITTDEKALRKLQGKVPKEHQPLFDMVLEVRNANYNIGHYLNSTLVRRGRMHTSYNIGASIKDTGTGRVASAPATGRLSSSRSIVLDSGTNLQNIPRPNDIASTRVSDAGEVSFTYKSCPVKSAFVPDKGDVLLEGDLSQAEARVVAYIARCEVMIEVVEKGLIHETNAAWIFDVPVEKVLKLQRQLAKTHVHAFNYDEGERQFAVLTGSPLHWARRIRGKYFQMFPEVTQWHREIQRKLMKDRVLTTLLGRKRTFFGRMNNQTFRSAYSFIPQGTVGELLNLILTEVYRRFKALKLKSKLCLQVHDSIGVSTRPEELEIVTEIMWEAARVPLTTEDGREFLIPIGFKTGPNWGEMEDLETPWLKPW